MFADARHVPADSIVEADLCIIGGGAAGITLAREFIGRSARIALLESGDLDFDQRTQSLCRGDLVGLPYFPLEEARLRYFGGTTNHWAGVSRPFDGADLERREWIPHSGWPITEAELAPFVERARRIVQLESDEWDTGAWVKPQGPQPLPFVGERVVTRVDQIVAADRRSFSDLYRDELRSASNVTVYLWANATEIEADEGDPGATHVLVATLSGNRFSVSARTLVLAAGGIENARLLLASRSRHPDGIGNQNDLVGRFFLEHPRFVAGVVAPASPGLQTTFYSERRVGNSIIQPRLALAREVQREEGVADVQIRVDPVHDEALELAVRSDEVDALKALRDVLGGGGMDDIGRHLSTVTADLMTWRRFVIPGTPLPVPYPEVIRGFLSSPPPARRAMLPRLFGNIPAFLYVEASRDLPVDSLILTARFEPVPNPESRVTLGTARDDLGVPRPRLDWRLSAKDRYNVRRTMEILGAEIGRAGFGRLRILFREHESGWPDDLAGGFHHIGTTRMSDDPAQGVVDRDCRVHGMPNLYLAGSSVFPTAGSGNPTLIIVALALRLAEHLRGSSA